MAAYPSPPFYNNYQYSSRPQHGYHQNPYPHHQQQQQQQHYPPKYPQHYPHHPHHPGYPPYPPQPQTPQSAGSPNFGAHHPPWQPHGPHGQGHQQHQGLLSPLPLLQQQQHHHVPRVMSPAYLDLPNQNQGGSPTRREPPQAQMGLNLENIEPSTPQDMDEEKSAHSSTSPAPPQPPHLQYIPQHPIQQSQHQQQEPIPQVSTYTQTGTVSFTSPAFSTTSFSSHTSPVSHTVLIAHTSPVAPISSALPLVSFQNTSTTATDARKPDQKAIWAVWSRRPQDPSHAPGIIISPSARPPPDVVKQALDIKTPPQSPVVQPSPLEISAPVKHVAPVDDEGGGGGDEPPPIPPLQFTTAAATTIIAPSNGETTDTSTVPSSSASMTEGLTDLTDLTDAPTVPGSPVSSTTSVSMSGVGVKHHIDSTANETAEAGPSAPTPTSPIIVGVTTTKVEGGVSQIADSATATAVDASLDAAITTVVAGPSTTAAAATSATVAGEASTSTDTTTAAPVPPPLKKSWASLLKTSSSTTPGSSVPSGRNMLPTSNVVGISIPASAMASSASSSSSGVSSGNKAELVALLTNGPGTVGNYASAVSVAANNGGARKMAKLKPRGLVNSGNMCFANSVLQMLVYTIPFQRLFFDIGRLGGTNVGLGTERNDGKDGSAGTTPLVDAMVEFVKEFFVTDGELYEGNAGSGNVTNVTVNGWGKGKEKERSVDEDEFWGTESFLPSYVYEAMKEKKRFDNMRGGQQEDAEEFLGFLLETLEEELVLLKEALMGTSSSSSSGRQGTKRPVEEREETAPLEERGWQEVGKKSRTVVTRTIKSTESPISKIFGGKFRTTLKVPHAKKDSVIVEDWRSIRLDIQRDQIHTVQDALEYISQPQPVQVTNPAGTVVEAHQVVHIDALPPVLVLHMKRFCYDTTVGGVVKVGKQVTFGPDLEIGNDVISHAVRKSQPPKYKLFGALYHHGLSASGGHYTLDVLHPTRFSSPGGRPREGWIRIDDELASDVRHEDVFEGQRDDNRSPYLLFYRRIR